MSFRSPSPKRIESRLGNLALQHVKPEHVDTALKALAQHVASLPKDHPAVVDEQKGREHADAFFKGAASVPGVAREVPKAAPPPAQSLVSRRAAEASSGYRWST